MWPSPKRVGPRFITLATRPRPGADLRPLTEAVHAQREAIQDLTAEVQSLRQQPPADAPALTVEQTARRLGCGRTRVYQLLSEGRLRPATKAGRQRMVTRASVDALLAAGETPSRKAKPTRSGKGAKDRASILALVRSR